MHGLWRPTVVLVLGAAPLPSRRARHLNDAVALGDADVTAVEVHEPVLRSDGRAARMPWESPH